jgi:Heterokaryon incompatibility protein (HET)
MSALPANNAEQCGCSNLYLALPPNETRVVSINSAQPGRDPEISLRTIDLEDPCNGDFRQDYIAISYTWGDPSAHVSLPICCSSGGVHHVAVSYNLIVLVAELYRRGIRIVWIDQLSINQASDAEKATQITLMKVIYERARAIFLWLGEKEDDSDLAMTTLHKLWDLHRQMATEYRLYQPGTAHLTRANLETLLGRNDAANIASWRAVEKLLQRPWWFRAWIVQEATVEEDRTTIYCGKNSITSRVLEALRDVYFALTTQHPVPGFEFLSQDVTFFDTLLNIYNFGIVRRRLPGGRPLLQLVSSIRTSKATDLRDKIWCIYGFTLDTNISGISPAMARSLSARQLYVGFTVWYLSTHKDLEVLGHCSDNAMNLPSWVPDWSVRAPTTYFPPRVDIDARASAPIFRASGPYKLRNVSTPVEAAEYMSGLRLHGIKISIVNTRLPLDKKITAADYASGRAWELYDTSDVESPSGCSMDELFARTLVADCRRSFTGSSWESIPIPATESPHNLRHGWFNPYQMRRTVGGRALFKTKTDLTGNKVLLGLGPQNLQPGDEVWLLRGGSVLYILRPRLAEALPAAQVFDCTESSGAKSEAEAEPFYQFIGEAFIQGLMDGQVLGMMGEHPKRARPSALKSMDRHFRSVLLI